MAARLSHRFESLRITFEHQCLASACVNHCVLMNPSCRFCSSLGRMSRSMRRLIVALGSVCSTFSQIHDRFVPSVHPIVVISGKVMGMFCCQIEQTTSLAKPVRMLFRCAVVFTAMLLKDYRVSKSSPIRCASPFDRAALSV